MSSTHPLTGRGEDEQSAAIREGMVTGTRVRREWVEALVAGRASVHDVVAASRTEPDGHYLKSLRLFHIVRARPGWTDATAIEALGKKGFKKTDTVRTIRRTESLVELFEIVFASTAERFRARPEAPPGYPWYGKLGALVRSSGEPVPDPLAALLGEDDVFAPAPEDVEDRSDPLAELLDLDDDPEED